MWARQLNSEGTGTRITNNGADLSILGLKVEQNCTAIENVGGANSEVLGGLIYRVFPSEQGRPAFINSISGRLYVAYTEEAYAVGSEYTEHVVQRIDLGQLVATRDDDLPNRSQRARVMPGRSFTGPNWR